MKLYNNHSSTIWIEFMIGNIGRCFWLFSSTIHCRDETFCKLVMLSFPMEIPKLNSMCPKLRHSKCIRLQRVAHHNTKTLQEIPAKLQIAPPFWNRNSFFTTTTTTPHPNIHIYMYIVYNLFTYVYYQTTQPSVKAPFPLTWSIEGIGHSPKPWIQGTPKPMPDIEVMNKIEKKCPPGN